PAQPTSIHIVVSIPPLAGLLRPLLPEGATLHTLVEPGRSPHGYEPAPSDIAMLGQADLVVFVGMGVESSLPISARSGAEVLVMAETLGLASREADDHADHDHAHGTGEADPHLWLDPGLVERFIPHLADHLHSVMQQAGAEAADLDALRSREADLLARVRALDADSRERLRPFAGTAIITHHPAWSRLASRYDLEIAAIIQPVEGAEPTPGHIADILAAAREHRVRGVFTEPQLDARIAERIASQIEAPLGTLDPLGRGDWEAMMRANLDELVRVLTTKTDG
ncbi:hypothetical protein MNBD_PLANCTO03-2055, partial [hydrothermal vent metagenome]